MGILKRDFQNFSDHFRFFLFTYLLLKFSSFWKTILMYFLHFSNHVNMLFSDVQQYVQCG